MTLAADWGLRAAADLEAFTLSCRPNETFSCRGESANYRGRLGLNRNINRGGRRRRSGRM